MRGTDFWYRGRWKSSWEPKKKDDVLSEIKAIRKVGKEVD